MTVNQNIKSGAELFWFNATLVAIQLSSKAGRDGICVVEHRMPYGDSPPLHVHRNEDEIFHILQGKMRFVVDGQETIGLPGQTVLAPKGLPHTFKVESVAGAHCLTITRGPDFEMLLRTMGRPADRAELPPAAAPTPEQIAALVKCAAENNIDIVGAPLA